MMTTAAVNDLLLQLHECGRSTFSKHGPECSARCSHPLYPPFCMSHDIDRRAVLRELRVARAALIEAVGDEALGFIARAEERER